MSVGVREAKMRSLFTSYCRKCSLVVSSFFCWWNMFFIVPLQNCFCRISVSACVIISVAIDFYKRCLFFFKVFD